MTVVVLSNTASADTFPVRKYEDGSIAIVSNHTQITGSRTAIRGDLWLSKMNGKGGYLMGTIANTRTLNDTLVSIKESLSNFLLPFLFRLHAGNKFRAV